MSVLTAIEEADYQQYLDALLRGDRPVCSRIVAELSAAGAGVKDLYLNLFQRSLYQVGELWEGHQISVATEHLATAITERVMALVQPELFAGPHRERSLIVACVADEFHQLGAKMVADLAELQGWRGYFLGANTPQDGMLDLVDRLKPDLVGLSLSITDNLPALTRALDALTSCYPELPVLVGGQALARGAAGALARYASVRPVTSLDQLEQELDRHAGL
jgi:MerR family transcriptional regulator, light-induced transcriptional regulator